MNKIEHARWCIKNCPVTKAENTIFWFLYGAHPQSYFIAKLKAERGLYA